MVDVALHGSKESVREAMQKMGLEGDALDMASHAATEHIITYSVNKTTGEARAVVIDGRKIL